MKRLIVLTWLLLTSLSFASDRIAFNPFINYVDPVNSACLYSPPQSNVYNMTIKQGSDLRIDFIWIDSDGDSISIDDNIVRMAIRKRVSSKDTLLYADTIGGEFVISSTETGYIRLTISGARTALLNFSTAYYDIEVVNTQGVIYDFCRGRIILIKEVTR